MTVRQLLSSLDSRELSEWQAEYLLRIRDEKEAAEQAKKRADEAHLKAKAEAGLQANKSKWR